MLDRNIKVHCCPYRIVCWTAINSCGIGGNKRSETALIYVYGCMDFKNLLLNSRKMALLMKFLLVVRTADVYLLKVALHEDVSKLNVAKGI